MLIVWCKIAVGSIDPDWDLRCRLTRRSSTWGGFKVGLSVVSRIRFRVSTGVDCAAGSNGLNAR